MENIIILPLYPQYAAATTATVCDEVYRTLMKMRCNPVFKLFLTESEPLYIHKNSINNKLSSISWKPDLILASYHGIPKNKTKVIHTIAIVTKLRSLKKSLIKTYLF